MNFRYSTFGTLAVLFATGMGALPASAATPPDAAFQNVQCSWLKDRLLPEHVIPDCMVEVPNGDFLGDDRYEYFASGCRYRHNWSLRDWFTLCPAQRHDAIEHMKPWKFIGRGAPEYGTDGKRWLGITLPAAGQGMRQLIPLPGRLLVEKGDFTYHVRVMGVVPWKDPGTVRMQVAFAFTGEGKQHPSGAATAVASGDHTQPLSLDFELKAPEGVTPDALGMRISLDEGSAPFRFDHVKMVREAK